MKRVEINLHHEIGDVVYLRLSEDKCGVIVSFMVCAGGSVLYGVTWRDGQEGRHYAIELSKEPVPEYAI